MKSFVFSIFLAVLSVAPANVAAEELRDPADFFDQTFGDLGEDADEAREEGKIGVLVMFETEDCPWCKRMKETVLNRVVVQDLYRRSFRIVSLNTEGDTTIVDFTGNAIVEKDFALKHNRVRATPGVRVLRSRGQRPRPLHRGRQERRRVPVARRVRHRWALQGHSIQQLQAARLAS
ncbi:MAG: thioredoxin family protein [Gammaproteobacteria bacterium]|nr:thioredoxin family protein [Gammaproteobacteria bacterium]